MPAIGSITSDIARVLATLADHEARIVALEQGIAIGPPPPAAPPSTYGTAINGDTKDNRQVGWTNSAVLAHRFRASTSSAITSVRFAQKGGSGYSGGTGGSMRISIQTDAAGVPSGVMLGSASYTPGNPGGTWAHYDNVPLSAPGIVAGTLYHVVYENTDSNQVANYISVNHLYVYGSTLVPRQPKFPDADYASLYDSGSGFALLNGDTADIDITYANGRHDGMGYIGMIGLNGNAVDYGVISGTTSMVRTSFTVTGGDRIVSDVAVRLRRTSGSGVVHLVLETGAGAVIEDITLPAVTFDISAPGGDNGGADWGSVAFASNHTLTTGQAYRLRLYSAAGTIYTAAWIRAGTDSGYDASLSFSDGGTEFTTNSGGAWTNPYPSSPLDIQFYFVTA